MKPAFTEGPNGLECISFEIREVFLAVELMATFDGADQMDNRVLPGIAALAEMISDRLADMQARTDAFVLEWQQEQKAAKAK